MTSDNFAILATPCIFRSLIDYPLREISEIK